MNGSIYVNTAWRGYDSDGKLVGVSAQLPLQSAVVVDTWLGLNRLRFKELRVVGGVNSQSGYENLVNVDERFHADCIPAVDPLSSLPNVENVTVNGVNSAGRTIVGLPLAPPVQLAPGTYDYINILSGEVQFAPGVYRVRGKHPITGHALLILDTAKVNAQGVTFLIDDSSVLPAVSGIADLGPLIPSVIIKVGLLGSRFSGPTQGEFAGLLIYQARKDVRPIVIVQDSLLGSGKFEGGIYAANGHVIIAGIGEVTTTVVCGTLRLVNLLNLALSPAMPNLRRASDVYIVE